MQPICEHVMVTVCSILVPRLLTHILTTTKYILSRIVPLYIRGLESAVPLPHFHDWRWVGLLIGWSGRYRPH